MPVKYLGLLILSPEEFVAELDSGGFNPNSTYESYLRMIESQVALAVRDRADAIRRGYDVRGVEYDLPPEMQAILDQARAELAAMEAAEEKEKQLPARAA